MQRHLFFTFSLCLLLFPTQGLAGTRNANSLFSTHEMTATVIEDIDEVDESSNNKTFDVVCATAGIYY